MSYKIDGTDIVISGWEEGISDNPYKGINDMRGVNIISVPGEASVSFAQTLNSLPSCSATVVSASDPDETVTITVTAGTLASYQAVTFTGASLPSGIVAGTTYWILKVNATTIKLYSEPTLTRQQLIGGTGTGTMATINMGEINYFEKTVGVALDDNGRAWWQPSAGNVWAFLGNGNFSGGKGIFYYKGYLFVLNSARICYLPFPNGVYDPGTALTWVNEWDPATHLSNPGINVFRGAYSHEALIGQDDVVYICDSSFVDSLFEKAGQTFNPADSATYTWNGKNSVTGIATYALKLPSYDQATCLEELGKNLMVGGTINYIYPWDRTSTSFTYPIKIAENYTFHLLTVNTNMFIFAGRRGRIYVTNSSQANLVCKIPDHISGIEPIYTWKNVCYNKNQIYFGISAKNNAQSEITSYVGLWAIDLTTNALRAVNIESNPLGTVTAVYAYNSVVSGFGLAVAWTDYSTNPDTYGIDKSSEIPYTDYSSYIETDLIPVGQFLKKKTFQNIEFKLSQPLVANEGIKISYRDRKYGAYALISECTTVGAISDSFPVNFDQSQWLQFKIEMKSTDTSPSYVRLTEIRLRDDSQQ